ncbi:odorant receptor 4-like isoform X1 [Zophobas morio]|uniref:odorant receptor 4-like isoform X1 n=1 Tax=Zophobas morio TaxID=2755281 RepID=UPI0030833915
MVFAYLRQQHNIAEILQQLSTFKNFGKPPGFDDLNRKLNLFAKVLTICEFATIVAYKIMRIVKKSECKTTLAELGLTRYYCGLGTPVWSWFDLDYFPVFHLFVLYGFLFALIHSKNCSQISYHVLEISYHATLRIDHLKSLIVSCFDSNNPKTSYKRFEKCVAYHNEILNLMEKIDTTFKSVMFGHFALTGAVCACLEKQIIDGHNAFTGFCHFMSWITAIFVVCVAGQRVINASESVSDALWTSKWYEADIVLQKCLLVMLTRSQKSCTLKAGPFGILSYRFFISLQSHIQRHKTRRIRTSVTVVGQLMPYVTLS